MLSLKAEASRYCALIEDEGLRGASLTNALILALVDLLQVAYRMPAVELAEGAPESPDLLPDVSDDEWHQVFRRLGTRLDAGYYWTAGSELLPFEARAPEPGVGDLRDDLADIWRDLVTGLRGLKSGAAAEDVLWQWQLDFESHWGEHAVDALRVLHALRYE